MANNNKRVTKVLTKKKMNSNDKNARHRLFGTYDINPKRHKPLTWEEIDDIPCIGEEVC